MELAFDINDGIYWGTLIVEVDPITTDESFDAHNVAGYLQSFGGLAVTDFKVIRATYYPVDDEPCQDVIRCLYELISYDSLLEDICINYEVEVY